ncbi:MAG: hypothetical protein WKF84_08740 [Pyrinomonadaceae bacterium]
MLENDLTTRQSREGDRFTLRVRDPAQYDGAVIEGYVSGLASGGRVTGRSQMTLNFERIRLRQRTNLQICRVSAKRTHTIRRKCESR